MCKNAPISATICKACNILKTWNWHNLVFKAQLNCIKFIQLPMSRNIGDDFNVEIWRILSESPNLKIANNFLQMSQKRMNRCQFCYAHRWLRGCSTQVFLQVGGWILTENGYYAPFWRRTTATKSTRVSACDMVIGYYCSAPSTSYCMQRPDVTGIVYGKWLGAAHDCIAYRQI